MIDDRDVEVLFTTDEEKLDLEFTLARMHIWLEEEKHMEVVKWLWKKQRPDSRMTEFLLSPQATPGNLISLLSHLTHNNFLSEFRAISCLMLMSEDGIKKLLNEGL